MTDQERAAVVAWLRDRPFPWVGARATLWHRLRAAVCIMLYGEAIPRGLCAILAFKIERGEHLRGGE